MSDYLSDFIDFFGLGSFFDGTALTVQEVLGMSILAFIGCIITVLGIKCVFELIKILTDWSKFK